MVEMWAAEIDLGNTHVGLVAPEDMKEAFLSGNIKQIIEIIISHVQISRKKRR